MYCNSRFEFAAFLKAKAQTCPSSDIVIIEDTQNTNKIDKRRIRENIIPETCVSQSNEHALKDANPFDESAQRNDANRYDIVKKIARNENQSKVTHESRESRVNDDVSSRNVHSRNRDPGQRTDAPSTSKTVVASDIFCGKIQKQVEIIAESCCSSGKETSDTVSDKDDAEQARVVSEISELDEVKVVKDLIARKMRRSIESQRKSGIFTTRKGDDRPLEEDALVSIATHDQQGDNYLISAERNNAHRTKDGLARLGKDDPCRNDGKSDHENWQESSNKTKCLKRPRIVSIQQIDNSGIIAIEGKRGKVLAEGSVEVAKTSKERESDPSRGDAGTREKDEKTKKSGIRERGGKARKTVIHGLMII